MDKGKNSETLGKSVTNVQWPETLNECKLKFGGPVYCSNSPVVVILNNTYLGGYEELKKFFHKKYQNTFLLDDNDIACVKEFSNFVNSTNRPFVYMHFSINNKHAGTMIFMLYSDIVPETCANFMRLCSTTKGGYPGTPVHRIVKDCWIQGGGFGLKSTDMICENFIVDFDKRGVLGMANMERHVDCSTQFFIISQPAQWMKHHYVAFGQLIDGNSTLKLIEEAPTWYECPTQDIRIEGAGILNLECHDIAINKNAGAYIDSHTENLYEVGEMCIEMLLNHVFIVILIRYLKALEEGVEEETEHEEREHGEGTVVPASSKTSRRPLEEESKEFDEESYLLETEYQYHPMSVRESKSPHIKPNVPYYIPLTDEPYPAEVDSTFDLKRFLTGKYCLEVDLQKDLKKKVLKPLKASGSSFLPVIDIASSTSISESSSLEDPQHQTDMSRVSRSYGEKICFGGPHIKQISEALEIKNVMDPKTINSVLTDEQLRRMKHVKAMTGRRAREVLMNVPDDHVGKKVKRKPTGFIRVEDMQDVLAKLSINETKTMDDDDNSDSDDDRVMKGHTSEVPSMKQNHLPLPQKIEMEDDPRDVIFEPHNPIVTEKKKSLQSVDTVDFFDDNYHQRTNSQIIQPILSRNKYSKTRPTITVSEYKNINRTSGESSSDGIYSGIRLPGDSPLYSMSGIHLLSEKPFEDFSTIIKADPKAFETNKVSF